MHTSCSSSALHTSPYHGAGSDDEADDDPSSSGSADAILRDFRYKLQCAYMEPGRDLKAGVLPKNNSKLIGNLVQFVCSGLIVASPSLAVARWNPFVCASTRPPAMEQGSSITKPCLWPALTKPTASWNPACTKLGCCLELGCYQGFLLFILIMFSGFDFSCFDCSLLDCFFLHGLLQPRSEMLKAEKGGSKFAVESRLTRVQEKKQANQCYFYKHLLSLIFTGYFVTP